MGSISQLSEKCNICLRYFEKFFAVSTLFCYNRKKSSKDVFFLKRLTSALLLLALLLALCAPVSAAAPRLIDYARCTDIVAAINGHAIRSFNVCGHVAVPAEELRGFGFRVNWDENARTLHISRAETLPNVWPDYTPPVYDRPVGERAFPAYTTDIRAYADGALIDCFTVSGEVLVWLRSLCAFGSVKWDAAANRSTLTLGKGSPPPAPVLTAVPNPTSPDNHKLYILMYHMVVKDETDGINDWRTTTALLRKDLQWLRDNGYISYLPGELAAGAPLAERSVLITFDDGYADNYRLALPLLREYGMKAVVSLVCGAVDRGEDGYLTWDMCREMAASGLIEFGSHTYDLHDGADGAPDGILRRAHEDKDAYLARVGADLNKSIARIKQETGQKKVTFLAYPHGLRDSWAGELVMRLFDMTVTTRHGAADLSDGLYGLPRCNINASQPVSMFLPRAK